MSVMNTLYVRCQTKDYILDIVAARAGMRINKVNSDTNCQLTNLGSILRKNFQRPKLLKIHSGHFGSKMKPVRPF